MKHHITKLPIVDYQKVLSTELSADIKRSPVAISIPLFYSKFQHIPNGLAAERFKQVHCKGAIWTALSFLKNTDFGDNGVDVYFHIEDKMYSKAMSVFKQFNVPDKYIRKMDFPKNAFPKISGITNIRSGKRFLCLLDEEVNNIDNWIILDSDYFACSTGPKIKLYDIFTCDPVRINPASIDHRITNYDTSYWLEALGFSAGIKKDLGMKEHQILKKLGLPSIGSITSDKVIRPKVVATPFSIPVKHPIVEYIKKHIWKCFKDEYLLAAYSLKAPFVNLRSFIEPVTYLRPLDFRPYPEDNYFVHLLFESWVADSFFAKFYRDITTHVDIPNNYVTEFENACGAI